MNPVSSSGSDSRYIQSPYVAYSPEALKQVSTWKYLKALKQFSVQKQGDSFKPLFKVVQEQLKNREIKPGSFIMTVKESPTYVPEKWYHAWHRRKEAAWFFLFKTLNRYCPFLLKPFQKPANKLHFISVNPNPEIALVLNNFSNNHNIPFKGPLAFSSSTSQTSTDINSTVQQALNHSTNQNFLNFLFTLTPEHIDALELATLFQFDSRFTDAQLDNQPLDEAPEETPSTGEDFPEVLINRHVIQQFAKAITTHHENPQLRFQSAQTLGKLISAIETRYKKNWGFIDTDDTPLNDQLESVTQSVSPNRPHQLPQVNGYLQMLFNILRESTEWHNAFQRVLIQQPELRRIHQSEQLAITDDPNITLEELFLKMEEFLPEETVKIHNKNSLLNYVRGSMRDVTLTTPIQSSLALKRVQEWIKAMEKEEKGI